MVDLEIVNLDEIEQKRRYNPSSPWKNARKLKADRIAETITPEIIYEKINKFNNIRDKCLFILLYITAGRVEELVRNKVIRWGKKNVRIIRHGKVSNGTITDYTKKKIIKENVGINKSNITIETIKGRQILKVNMRNLKNKQTNYNRKVIPLPLDTEINKKFYIIINQYLSTLYPEEELFPIGKRRAEQIISLVGFNPHFLRTCRLTHLVRYYNFSDQKLKVFAGWTDSRPAKFYINIGWEDLVNSML